ncbi:MAG: ArgP/LysG family DNA-binding transcriptional regulator, partial [Nannocystaceae bacterium]|nr:ArgP/LysG family DNA-binding transcriptional regulator [Nannocystaceae bacterium]
TLATWLVPALREFAARNNVRIDVKIADEDDTAQWLRSGKAVGVVTSEARPLQGCRVAPLGVMRYRATASPRFVRRWLADGATVHALRAAPSLAYNRKDELCEQFLSESPSPVDTDGDIDTDIHTDIDTGAELHAHFLPSPNAHVQACLEGLGWGMNPQPLVASLIKRRRLVDLSPQRTVDVALYWQQWSISSTSVDALACSLREHAQQALAHEGAEGARSGRG